MWKIIHLPTAQVMDKFLGNLPFSFDTRKEAVKAITELAFVLVDGEVLMRYKDYKPWRSQTHITILNECEFEVFDTEVNNWQ